MKEAIEEIGQQDRESTEDRDPTSVGDDHHQTSEEERVKKKSLKPRLIIVKPMKEEN